MTVAIRPARASDADFLARAILVSQRGHVERGWLDIKLGLSEAETLTFTRRLTLARTRSWWHLSTFLVADVDGTAAATLCAIPARGTTAGARAALEEIGPAMGMDMAAVYRRGSYVSECWMDGDPQAWLIEHVATHPDHRGRGLAPALLEHALAAGKRNGHSAAQITFLIGNEPAQRSYLKAGFQFAEEKRSLAFEAVTGSPGFRRYEREI